MATRVRGALSGLLGGARSRNRVALILAIGGFAVFGVSADRSSGQFAGAAAIAAGLTLWLAGLTSRASARSFQPTRPGRARLPSWVFGTLTVVFGVAACGSALAATGLIPISPGTAGGGAGQPPNATASRGPVLLVITAPGDGAIVSTAQVSIQGTGPAGARVVRDISFAADQDAQVAADGSWQMSVSLNKGSNTFTFRIGDDRSTAIQWRVDFEPPPWYPAGFMATTQDAGVAYKWTTPDSCAFGTCWQMEVTTQNGCLNGFLIELSVLNSGSTIVGTTAGVVGTLPAGEVARLSFVSVEPDAASVRIDKVSCH